MAGAARRGRIFAPAGAGCVRYGPCGEEMSAAQAPLPDPLREQSTYEILLRAALDALWPLLSLAHAENRVLRDQIKLLQRQAEKAK